ncbi:bifunctional riboflavin kinase/FAD synthetase [Solitalea koreensis]|uniref:Riboflavin biosynthesis protein n=1 Tax=Solitalea koreensis TaxID=543615 RepID=A0A521AGH3_9SPHI|nr:bifunctional riboflavin kinase/FAD synthetase [Solitalea koreensis]SMO33945.1 riboflavin kinase / FMN adenylyltransferase [Solitalea koreensis]
MKIYKSLEEFDKVNNPVVTLGTFDGVHFGHRKILQRLLEIAHNTQGETVILTFFPHPRMILHPEDENLKLINTMDEKIQLLEAAGIDHLLIIPFTRDFSNLTSKEFIKKILVDTIETKKLVIGYDHRFGKDREGSFEHLKQFGPKYGFDVEEISEQDVNDVAVSSTRIRNALFSGDVKTANEFLGYNYLLKGKVVKGDQIGRKIGFPTANLFIEETYKLIPSDGIYAVKVHTENETYGGMLYIGHRPTINGMTRNIEVNIFNFDQDIYNQKITLEFVSYLRGDIKFDGLPALKVQLTQDEIDAKAVLNAN